MVFYLRHHIRTFHVLYFLTTPFSYERSTSLFDRFLILPTLLKLKLYYYYSFLSIFPLSKMAINDLPTFLAARAVTLWKLSSLMGTAVKHIYNCIIL